MRVVAVVILYHPHHNVVENIKSYHDYVEDIWVFDNTVNEPSFKEELLQLSKVSFYHDGKNEGIARRLNYAAQMAIDKQYDWLLTMDQDSNFSGNTVRWYFECFHQFAHKQHTALIGPRYSRQVFTSTEKCIATHIHELITSGTLLNLHSFKAIGPFDEALFIDSVDHDYCIRARLKGFSIIEFSNINILHELGNQVHRASIKTLFLFAKKKEIHSPLRCYYMYRNLLYLERKHKRADPVAMRIIRKVVVNHIKTCIFYGRTSWKIMKYLVAGHKDFKKMKMGKIEKEL